MSDDGSTGAQSKLNELFGYIYSESVHEVNAVFRAGTGTRYELSERDEELVHSISRKIVEITIFRCASVLDQLSELPRADRPALAVYDGNGQMKDYILDCLGGSGEFAGDILDGIRASPVGSFDRPRESDRSDSVFPRFDS